MRLRSQNDDGDQDEEPAADHAGGDRGRAIGDEAGHHERSQADLDGRVEHERHRVQRERAEAGERQRLVDLRDVGRP